MQLSKILSLFDRVLSDLDKYIAQEDKALTVKSAEVEILKRGIGEHQVNILDAVTVRDNVKNLLGR